MYNLTRNELKEIASDLLACSTDNIRVRARICKAGDKILEDDGKVYFAMCISNLYAKVNANGDGGYSLQQQYNDSRFALRGEGVWIPDKMGFFFSACKSAPEVFIYLEFVRF